MKNWKEKLCAVAMLLVGLFLVACASKATKAVEKVELGQKYLTELNYTEAVASFTEAIGLDPENIPAYMGRAEAYVALKQYDDAKADYTTAIEKTADQPYMQAQAYAGRAEVNELTEELQDAESDYEAAQELLEAEDIGEKAQVEDDVLTAFRKKVLYARAVLCTKLGLYEGAVDSYEKLTALGEDVTEEHTRVLDAALWAISTTQDLGAASQWMASHKVPKGDEIAAAVKEVGNPLGDMSWGDMPEISSVTEDVHWFDVPSTSAKEIAAKMDLQFDNNQKEQNAVWTREKWQELITNGFEIRYYAASDKMVAVYCGETAWPEENSELTEKEAFFKAYQDPDGLKKDIGENFWNETIYLYEGEHSGKLREGKGCWGILNGADDDWEKEFYQWENNEPIGGFLKKTSYSTVEQYPHYRPPATRTRRMDYSIGGTQIILNESWDDTENMVTAYGAIFKLSAPILDVSFEKRWATVVLPAGTTIEYGAIWDAQNDEWVRNITLGAGEQCSLIHISAAEGFHITFEGR